MKIQDKKGTDLRNEVQISNEYNAYRAKLIKCSCNSNASSMETLVEIEHQCTELNQLQLMNAACTQNHSELSPSHENLKT